MTLHQEIATTKKELQELRLDGAIYNVNKVYKIYFGADENAHYKQLKDIQPFHSEWLSAHWRSRVIDKIRHVKHLKKELEGRRCRMTPVSKYISKNIPSKRIRRWLRPVWDTHVPLRIASTNDIHKVNMHHKYISHDEKAPSHMIIPREILTNTADQLYTKQNCKTAVLAAELMDSMEHEDYEVYKVALIKRSKKLDTLQNFSIEHSYAAVLTGNKDPDKVFVNDMVAYAKRRENLDQRLSTKANQLLKTQYTQSTHHHEYIAFIKELDRQIHYSEFKPVVQTIIGMLDTASYEYNIALNALKSNVA